MAKEPGFVERGIGVDVEDLKKEVKRLADLNDKAVVYEFGEGDKRVKVVKEGKTWRVRDIYGGHLTKAKKWVVRQTPRADIEWDKKEDAIKAAEEKAKADGAK